MKHNLKAWIISIMIVTSLLSGCRGVSLKRSYGKYYSDLTSDSYNSEITRLSAMTDESKPTYWPAAYLYLSLLYSSYNNPEKDYLKAHEALEKYLSLAPAASSNYEVENLRVLLKEINSAKMEGLEEIKLKKDEMIRKSETLLLENKKLGEMVEAQKIEISDMEETINQLNETIDKLKNLDMELEKKRKSFR